MLESETFNTSGSTDFEQIPTDVEGHEVLTVDGWGDGFPIDSVFVRTEVRTVNDVVSRINDKRFILNPEFQRDFVWPVKKQTKLIESCFMRIPLPVFYVAENEEGEIIVVDGLQRLTTFRNFVEGKFKLTGLSKTNELEGKKISDLHVKLRERVLDTQLTLYILDPDAPDRAKMEIFERVNSGEPLSRQQMRNALFFGAATQWLKEMSERKIFREATGSSLNQKTMRDREAINRFIAFYLIGWQNYNPSGDMDKFLADGIKQMNELTPEKREEISNLFELSMKLCLLLFGEHSFRRSLRNPNNQRSVINISLFDVISVTFTQLLARLGITSEFEQGDVFDDSFNECLESIKNKEQLKQAIIELLLNEEFSSVISHSTNNKEAVSQRYQMVEEALDNYYEENYG